MDRPRVRDEMLRSFVAIDLDPATRDAAARLVRSLAARSGDDVRWVKAGSLHVTLRFLGDVAASRIPELVRHTAPEVARIAPFRLRLGDVVPFPGRRRPRVVALELAPLARLEALFHAVERGVVAAGFEAESRPFRPHLTLGRIGRGGRFPDVTDADTPRPDPLDVTEAVLFRSDLGGRDPRYTPLARLPLAPAEPPDAPRP